MALPTNRQEFRAYCLRRLGHPVIEINVSEDQIDDRIDDAIAFWKDYHYDGLEKVYYKHQMTAADIAAESLSLPEAIQGVTRVLNFSSLTQSSGMFNVQYQFVLNNMNDLISGNISNYWIMMNNIQTIDYVLNGLPMIRFNKHTDKLYIDEDWSNFKEGDWIVLEAFQELDPDVHTDVWKDKLLLKYATALIKKQWGSNLIKFSGMTLPGGLQFNGEQIFNDASQEVADIESEAILSYSLPVDMFQG